MSSAICFNLDQPKILSSGNGLRVLQRNVFHMNHTQEGTMDNNTPSEQITILSQVQLIASRVALSQIATAVAPGSGFVSRFALT